MSLSIASRISTNLSIVLKNPILFNLRHASAALAHTCAHCCHRPTIAHAESRSHVENSQVFLNESATYSPDNWLVSVDQYACMALQMNITLLTLFSLWLYLFVNIGFYYSCSEKGPESSSPR